MKKKTSVGLINNWILFRLFQLQEEYKRCLFADKLEFNVIVSKLLFFVQKTLSKEYLELFKIIVGLDPVTKKVLLFVYQQVLLLLNPMIPFLTSELFKQLTKEKITDNCFQFLILNKKEEDFWSINCFFLLVVVIRKLQKEKKINSVYLYFMEDFQNKIGDFDWIFFVKKFVFCQVFLLSKKKEEEELISKKFFCQKLFPYVSVYYFWEKKITKEQLEEDLLYYQFEYQRSSNLLNNNSFLAKAAPSLVTSEKKKQLYFQKQIENIKKQKKNISF